ncbi:unnamed protein product [Haemonchus placei]|uniref:Skp1_POZ domain-containing protein n=1 Tax=Haemonchus placei TaxID=6290 RepID=A0A0N4X0R8_HAEPC|nr:unnamed protein product [Haemonchus placei]
MYLLTIVVMEILFIKQEVVVAREVIHFLHRCSQHGIIPDLFDDDDDKTKILFEKCGIQQRSTVAAEPNLRSIMDESKVIRDSIPPGTEVKLQGKFNGFVDEL